MSIPDVNLDGEIFDAVNAGLIVLGADCVVVRWNRWLEWASGITQASALGFRLDQLFPAKGSAKINTAVADALATGSSRILTHTLHPELFPLKTRSGRPLIHDIAIKPIGGTVSSHCLVQITDVTVAAERERILRERQNARYAAVVDNAPDAILTVDAEGVIQFANPAANREFGYRPGDLVGHTLGFLFGDQAAWAETWAAVSEGRGNARQVEVVAHRADGTPSYLELSAARWITESRVFVSAILRDVNERHAAEAQLRRLNETLEERVAVSIAERKILADIFDDTDAFIQVIDRSYNWLAINRASRDEIDRVYGIRAEVGHSILDTLAPYPQDQEKIRALWARALAGEEFTAVQTFGRSGTPLRHYEMKFNALRDDTGHQFGAFQFAYDVTDRVEQQAHLARTEEALRQSQKMEAIGQLTGGIAHDFNNMLTGVIGAMDILKRRIAAGKFEDTQRFMDAAAASAHRAAALTHRLLAFARRQPLDPKAVDLNQLVKGVEDLLRRTLGEHIRFETELVFEPWLTMADANQLENAILNLVINARDAMPDGGHLIIGTQNQRLDQAARFGLEEVGAGDYAVVSVKDSGSGIAPEIIEKVFDPFFTTKPIGQGTGLGLSMIYGFAKQSLGHVHIESAVGEGTTVSLILPRFHGPLSFDRREGATQAPAGKGESVLLVEDDSSVRLLIGEVLRDLGYSCVEAVDAKAALPILESDARLDLLITDIGLPVVDGREVAATARLKRPNLKILFVTGYAKYTSDIAQLLGKDTQMITKPFSLDALALKIRELLSAVA